MKHIIILLLLIFTLASFGQDHDDHDDHDHEHHHAKNEIGFSFGPVLFINAKEWNPHIHLHYQHQIMESRYAWGLGFEKVFDDHKHNNFSLMATYRPLESLSLQFAPGLTFEGNDFSTRRLALHAEVLYEFDLGPIHLGPAVALAYDQEDYHFGLAVHFGFGF